MGSPRWRRNQRLKCSCTGYHFPHRKGGGACDFSKTCGVHRSRRDGDKIGEIDAHIDLVLAGHHPHNWSKTEGCPF
jgi:hypothetical protein